MAKTRDKIIDLAEAAIRSGGFDSFSFRDIAKSLGIKSASVHYHFATKADLGVAVITRYQQRMLSALGEPTQTAVSPKLRIEALAAQYARANRQGPCMGAVLHAVLPSLPPKCQTAVMDYQQSILTWIEKSLGGSDKAKAPAAAILSMLQGATIVQNGLKSDETVGDMIGHAARLVPWGLRVDGLTGDRIGANG